MHPRWGSGLMLLALAPTAVGESTMGRTRPTHTLWMGVRARKVRLPQNSIVAGQAAVRETAEAMDWKLGLGQSARGNLPGRRSIQLPVDAAINALHNIERCFNELKNPEGWQPAMIKPPAATSIHLRIRQFVSTS